MTTSTAPERKKTQIDAAAVAARVGELTRLTPKRADLGDPWFWMLRNDVVTGMARVVFCAAPEAVLPMSEAQDLRDLSAAGIAARLICVSRRAVYVQEIGPLAIEAWIELRGADRVAVYPLEPMRRLCDADERWFL